jgi:hypothetical protein
MMPLRRGRPHHHQSINHGMSSSLSSRPLRHRRLRYIPRMIPTSSENPFTQHAGLLTYTLTPQELVEKGEILA